MNLRSRRKLLSVPLVARTRRAVGLTRGSTVRQQLTLGAQTEAIRRFTTFQQFELARVFEDSGTSGGSRFLERESVKAMLRYMADERITEIVCARLDRAFRSVGDAIYTLTTLHEIGVTIHFSEQPLPDGALGKMMFQILAVFAEFEKNLRLERQLEAGERQRALCQKSGINVPYGWAAVPAAGGRRTKENRSASDLVPVPEQQDVLRQILLRSARGESDQRIADVLNTAGIPTAKAGQMIRRGGVERMASGRWYDQTVFSVRSFARLAEPIDEDEAYDEQ